jgi:hypothetical protein
VVEWARDVADDLDPIHSGLNLFEHSDLWQAEED